MPNIVIIYGDSLDRWNWPFIRLDARTRGAFSIVIIGEVGFGIKRGVFLYAIIA